MSHILSPGTVIENRYRVVQLIGKGGMGAVYEAVHINLGSTVALKQMFLDPNLPQNQAAIVESAFKREAKTLNQLRHPALPRVSHYFLDHHNGHFLEMDYIQGNDLNEWLTQRMRSTGKPFTGDDRDGSYFVSLHPHLFMDALVVWHRKPATTIPHTVFTFNE